MLRSLLLAAFAAVTFSPTTADAQIVVPTDPFCSFGSWEINIGILDDTPTVNRQITVTVWRAGSEFDAPIGGTPATIDQFTNGGCGFRGETNNPADVGSGNGVNDLTGTSAAERLLTIEIRDPSFTPDRVFRYTYHVCNTGDAQVPGFGLYCSKGEPQGAQNLSSENEDTAFYYDYDAGVVYVEPTALGSAINPEDPNSPNGFDDFFVDQNWVLPYAMETGCEATGCNGAGYWDVFLTPQHGDPATGAFITPLSRSYAMNHDVEVLTSTTLDYSWDLGGETVSFYPGATITANRGFDVDDMTLTASDGAQGWGGIHYAAGSTGTLTDATVSGVRVVAPPGGGGFGGFETVLPDGAAITATDADVTLDGITEVFDTVDGFGVLAEGRAKLTLSGSSTIRNNQRYGAKAVGDAEIVLDGGTLKDNTMGGVFASGGTFTGVQGKIEDNLGSAVEAEFQGTASFARSLSGSGSGSFAGGSSSAQTVEVRNNRGGLYAGFNSSVTSVPPACAQPPCDPANAHQFVGNDEVDAGGTTVAFDARAASAGHVGSAEDFWGTGITEGCTSTGGATNPECQLAVETVGSGTVAITPAAPSSAAARSGAAHAGTSAAKSGGLAEAVRDAETAAVRGDLVGALAATLAVTGGAFTDDEVEAAYGLAARLGARYEMPALTAWLAAQGNVPGAHRAHAHAARGAAHAGAGRTAAAQAAYRQAARGADGALALRVHRALVTLAVEARDLGAATEAVGGFLAAEPTDAQLAEVAGVVTRAFPGARFAEARRPGVAKTGTGTAAPSALLSAPYPNPTSSAAEVRFALAEAGAVRLAVYDALGREVAVLADGEREAGPHAARLDAAALAPGVYLVRLATGEASATTQLTVAR